MNGYEFYPEDGSTLYEEEAWELSEQARSLWLRLTFAGEYSEGMSPVQIQGRKYLPMFPARDGVYTIEQVREKFLAVFSKEFTDKTLNAAIASKDLLEYNGNVYTAYKKNRGETSYNSWADHVRDDGAGKFTVVMGVSMPPDGSTVYVELPTGKNAAGKFVCFCVAKIREDENVLPFLHPLCRFTPGTVSCAVYAFSLRAMAAISPTPSSTMLGR